MSVHETKTWLVAYDIREDRRLRRVHRQLRKAGLAAQYSAFTVQADDEELRDLLQTLEALIDHTEDDVRAYHIPRRCPVWRLGYQAWPEEVTLTPGEAVRLLMNETTAHAPADGHSALEPL